MILYLEIVNLMYIKMFESIAEKAIKKNKYRFHKN